MLGGEKLADTREATKAKRKAPKREDTIAKTKAEGTNEICLLHLDDFLLIRVHVRIYERYTFGL